MPKMAFLSGGTKAELYFCGILLGMRLKKKFPYERVKFLYKKDIKSLEDIITRTANVLWHPSYALTVHN